MHYIVTQRKRLQICLTIGLRKYLMNKKNHNYPKQKTLCSVGYLKNIDIKLSDQQIKGFLENKECKVQQVKRVFYRHSGKPMPIRKVHFACSEDLSKACKVEYPFKINGKQAFCEEEKSLKIVRCFNCHLFNHISAHCPNSTACENCGSEEHSKAGDCHLQSKCSNCKGNHRELI